MKLLYHELSGISKETCSFYWSAFIIRTLLYFKKSYGSPCFFVPKADMPLTEILPVFRTEFERKPTDSLCPSLPL